MVSRYKYLITLVNYNIRSFAVKAEDVNLKSVTFPMSLRLLKLGLKMILSWMRYQVIFMPYYASPIWWCFHLYFWSITAEGINDLSYASVSIEIFTVNVIIENSPTILLSIYRPHCVTVEHFQTCLEWILNDNRLQNKNCIVMEDFSNKFYS